MRMDLILGRRVLKNGLVLATTLITCTALQADDKDKISSPDSGGPQTTERATGSSVTGAGVTASANKEHGNQQEKFVQKALMSGQMEVQMGQLAQQNGQNQQVKSFGQTLVQDHTQANQKLQQIAQKLNISAAGGHGGHDQSEAQKHQQHMQKLQGKSGAEFDKEFSKMAVKHHKKDISEFERAQAQVNDPELKSFIQQTLPKLRQHLQTAQAMARAVGLDESSLAADDDANTAAGAPATIQSGSERPGNSTETDRNKRSSIDTDGSSISGDARIGDRSINSDVSADVDTTDKSATVDVDADADVDGKKVFQKGDGKVLGLPTDKNDGKFLGVIPNPRANNDDADTTVDADIETDNDASVGAAARSETGTADDKKVEVEVETDK